MNMDRNLDDAAVVFRALDRRHAAVLLSHLEITDAQLLLATAAQSKPVDATRLSELLPHLQQVVEADRRAAATDAPSIEQLLTLSNRQIKTLLASVSTAHWAPALRQTSDDLSKHILRNVAPAVATLLKAEINGFVGGKQATTDAREKILAVAERLRFLNGENSRNRAG